MARMKRVNITLDERTIEDLKKWKRMKSLPASYIIREAVTYYTWKNKEKLAPRPEDFEGIDVPTNNDTTVEYD